MWLISSLSIFTILSILISNVRNWDGKIEEEHIVIVYPRIFESTDRRRRNINSDVYTVVESSKLKIIEVGDWSVELNPESNLVVTPTTLKVEWITSNGNGTLKEPPPTPQQQCDYQMGYIRGLETLSKVAFTICQKDIIGYMNVDGEIFFLQPTYKQDGSHKLFRSNRVRRFLTNIGSKVEQQQQPPEEQWLFNLTGDTIDIGDEIESKLLFNHDNSTDSELDDDITTGQSIITEATMSPIYKGWRREQLNQDELGYFYDTAWTIETPIRRKTSRITLPEKWLEIAIAADYTLISFHGKDKVTAYILALMNIVNAIYQDVSLEANMKLVITRLQLYEHKKQSVVRPGSAKRSLENVNSWNNRLHASLAHGEAHHDIAIWLTRSDIGGPSGYAPVGGVCDPKRSCALNRDEGLSSAFIIAHEMAHVLGLSHDGDLKASNKCDKISIQGTVMAPLVAATFNKFAWSECSRKEFKRIIKKWSCLSNPPAGLGEIVLNATLQNAFSMDEQCRMEFGEGFSLCRAFDIIEPCSHLWCGHNQSPLVCKTKKGSPLEGTQCGFNKWCVNGYCQGIEREHSGKVPLILNPQDGGWSEWSPWGPCSRSCGTGAQFRTRKCDNPKPLHGGRYCEGLSEEWQICNKQSCPQPFGDMRAQQCKKMSKLLNLNGTKHGNMSWLPFESQQFEKKCKLLCISEETKEVFESTENLIDGTPCSYENTDNICIQGTCQLLGCDGQLLSNMKTDLCGVCGGNNSDCSTVKSVFSRKLKREVSRVAVIPRMATEIKIEANVTALNKSDPSVAFILKNRRKKKYRITVPNVGLRTEIMEGTRFYYEKMKNRHKIWAKGPVLAEMVVLVYTPISEIESGLNVSLYSEYIIHKEIATTPTRYKWILGGWGPCSASCGGGRRQQTVACWDIENQKLVRRKYCSLITKPETKFEKCNEYECNFQWIAGKWEPCTATCGLHGVQSRELYCVPQTILNEILFRNNGTIIEEPWKFMVNPKKCSGVTPPSSRSCNREACPSFWSYEEWSQCSASCGKGISFRSSYCPPPSGENFFTCGEAPPPNEKRICHGHTRHTNTLCKGRKKKTCIEDQSPYCSLKILAKYCKLGGFRRLCCKSCITFKMQSLIFL